MNSSILLTLIIFTPLIFGLLVALLPSQLEAKFRQIALIQTIVNAVLATVLYMNFDGSSAAGQFNHLVSWLPDWGINYFVLS